MKIEPHLAYYRDEWFHAVCSTPRLGASDYRSGRAEASVLTIGERPFRMYAIHAARIRMTVSGEPE